MLKNLKIVFKNAEKNNLSKMPAIDLDETVEILFQLLEQEGKIKLDKENIE